MPFDIWSFFEADDCVLIPDGATLTIYVLGYDASTAGKRLSLDNITAEGTIIPEPHTVLLIITASVSLVFRRRRCDQNRMGYWNYALVRLSRRCIIWRYSPLG